MCYFRLFLQLLLLPHGEEDLRSIVLYHSDGSAQNHLNREAMRKFDIVTPFIISQAVITAGGQSNAWVPRWDKI